MKHLNFDYRMKLSKKEDVRDLPNIVNPPNLACKHCQHGKQTKTSFKLKEHTTSQPFEIVHTDLCGPTRTKSFQGDCYFMVFIDYYTRMTWVTFLKEKSEAFENFKICKAMIENETNQKIKCLRSDDVGKFNSNEFNEFCEMHGVKIQFSTLKTHH